MIDLGLDADEHQLLYDTLTVSNVMRSTVHLLDLDHRVVEDVSDRLMDGQSDYSINRVVVSDAECQLFDPTHSLGFDMGFLAAGQVHTNRLVQASRGVWIPHLRDWIDVPLFTGRVVAPSRDGDMVTLVCQGKEQIMDRPAWGQRSWRRGSRKTDIIRAVLNDFGGEPHSRMNLPTWPDKTAVEVGVGRGTNIWGFCQKLAASMSAQLFYDGRGHMQLRKVPSAVQFTFTDGPNAPDRTLPAVEGGTILYPSEELYPSDDLYPSGVGGARLAEQRVGATLRSKPKASYDVRGKGFINTVWVTGRPGTAGAATPTYTATFPPDHPLSAQSNAVNGVPEVRFERINDDTIRSFKEAKAVAEKRSKFLQIEYVNVDVMATPILGLEPGDMTATSTVDGYQPHRLRQFSMPWTHDGDMSVGVRRRVSRGAWR